MAYTVGIVGSGAAGLSASILLSGAGHRATVFEQTEELRPVGAGLLLQPTGMDVLERLDAADALAELGVPIRRLFGTTDRGKPVLDLRYADLRADLAGVGIQRAALCSVLARRAHEAGAEIRLGQAIGSIDTATPDKPALISATGERSGPFDLVIAADGARSKLRTLHPGLVRRDRAYAWGALWFIGDDPEHRYGDTLRQVYRGSREMIGFLPSGRAAAAEPNRVSLFWSMPCAQWAGPDQFDLHAWKREVRALTDLADPLLEQIDDPRQLVFAPYRDVILRRPSVRRVAFLGDAAHAMSPQLGQGVNLAMLDAEALATAVGSCDSIPAALQRYRRARRGSNAIYQLTSRWLTPFFQSDLPLAGRFRDLTFGALCNCPPTRDEILRTLCGIKDGILHSAPMPERRG